ncbi:uncharacterized protein LOC106669508 isoform X2 [Cimex lectularius]|uniref:Centriolar and ciliogenesis-associated protein HYLS1 C-terminal domain-containing protein n=1 Tax=Cimex lectularius TaxID=79782 RepID=A0A8I6S071_CIMLE|nr:uncharacterized protein LOC106669508 isoform X2 [Cimex lectularius]
MQGMDLTAVKSITSPLGDLKKLIKYDTRKGDKNSSDGTVKKKGESELAHSFKSTKFVMKKQYATSINNHLEGSANSSTSDESYQSAENTDENDKENAMSVGRSRSKISCTLQCSKKNCSIHGSVNSKSLPKRPNCIYCQSNGRQPSKEGGLSNYEFQMESFSWDNVSCLGVNESFIQHETKELQGAVSSVCNCPRCRPEYCSKKDELPPCGSFIRPSSSSSRQGKSDPVALYHRYQSVWSQQNLPGENPHANLRWKIRHKMMGPNPSKIEDRKAKTAPDRPPWVDP